MPLWKGANINGSDFPGQRLSTEFPNPMKRLKRIAAVMAAVLATLAAAALLVPVFVTMNDYVPLVEKELSARLQEPVSIDSLRVSLFPLPHGTLEGITVGDAEDIKVRKATLRPALWSLLGATKVIRSLDFEDVVLSQKALGALVALTQGDRGSSTFRVENVRLRNALVKLERGSFGPFDLDVDVSTAGEGGDLTLAMQDGSLKARVRPKGERFAIDIAAKSWVAPLGPPIRFDELSVTGEGTAKGAELSAVEGKLYGGTLAGKATLGWDKGVSVKGQLELRKIELNEASALFSPRTRLSGRLDAKPSFSAAAAKAEDLDEALRVETPFAVHEGVLLGFDLVAAAAAALTKQGSTGGQTRFDELAGHLVLERQTYRVTQLRVSASGLAARGHVTIAPSKALTGQLDTTAKGVPVAIPLTLAGTLDAPVIQPNTKALIGAAAGTVLLGPGLGTAAGATLGDIAEGLLGKPRKR